MVVIDDDGIEGNIKLGIKSNKIVNIKMWYGRMCIK